MNDSIDEFVRDVTAVGSRPKSEVKRRLLTLLSTAKKEEYKKGYNACLKENNISNEYGEKSL